jgi:hypothetical protein
MVVLDTGDGSYGYEIVYVSSKNRVPQMRFTGLHPTLGVRVFYALPGQHFMVLLGEDEIPPLERKDDPDP